MDNERITILHEGSGFPGDRLLGGSALHRVPGEGPVLVQVQHQLVAFNFRRAELRSDERD
jgi:hypothetical protein